MSIEIFPKNIPPYLPPSIPLQDQEKILRLYAITKNIFTSITESYSKLQNIRIIQKNLVYLIGLSKELAFKDSTLSQFAYLGQYGTIKKLVVNKNKTYNGNGPNGPSYSCHVTYSSIDESSLAILSLDNANIDNHILKASYGTTKYCSNFLKGQLCLNKNCLYLHSLANKADIISRDEMNANKNVFEAQHIMAIELSEILTSEKKKRYLNDFVKGKNTVFPNANCVYDKDIVKRYIKEHKGEVNEEGKSKSKKKRIVSLIDINRMFESRKVSRFDFAQEDPAKVKGDISDCIEIPEKVSSFISENFKRSILFKKENKDTSSYCFAMKKKANEAEDRWGNLLMTLEFYSQDDSYYNNNNSMKKINENDNYVLVNKFYSM